jgi:hypothetical protein
MWGAHARAPRCARGSRKHRCSAGSVAIPGDGRPPTSVRASNINNNIDINININMDTLFRQAYSSFNTFSTSFNSLSLCQLKLFFLRQNRRFFLMRQAQHYSLSFLKFSSSTHVISKFDNIVLHYFRFGHPAKTFSAAALRLDDHAVTRGKE